MKTVAVISQKGGSGKTTLSINLAIAATETRKQAVIIDLDPQQSATRWGRLRTAEQPVIVPGHGPNLADLVARAEAAGADFVFIDTAPKSESAALAAAKLADLVLIPCQPSSLDLDAIADTVNIVALAKRPAAFVLNAVRASSSLAEDAEEALSEYAIPLAPVRIASRVVYIRSLANGKGVPEYAPHSPAALEIAALFNFISQYGG